jgi:hypothetical protein
MPDDNTLNDVDTPEDTQEIVLTRSGLYEAVWREPVMVLAKRYGLSDRGLGKLCARYNVPVPPRGYWALKKVGQTLRRPPLPPAAQSKDVTLRFVKQPQVPAPETVAEPADIVFERQPENEVVVSDHTRLKHPLVLKTKELLHQAHCDERGIYYPVPEAMNIKVSEASRTRALRVVEMLIRALEQRGHSVRVETKKEDRHGYSQPLRTSTTIATVLGEDLAFGIEEHAKQVYKGKGIDLRGKPVQQTRTMPYEFVPDGRLRFEIHTWSSNGRRRWTDGTKHKLEDYLNDIIVGLLKTSHAIKDARVEAERQRERERIAEELRREEARLRAAELARIRRARRQADALNTNRHIRRLLRELAREAQRRNQPIDSDSELGKWMDCMQAYVERNDPIRQLLEGASVEAVGAESSEDGERKGSDNQRPTWSAARQQGWPYTPWYQR